MTTRHAHLHNNEEEAWKPCYGFPGYQVSSLGNVKGKKGQLMKPGVSSSGYRRVNLTLNRSRQQLAYVHILVLESFVGKAPSGHEACHGVMGPLCNHVYNLSWGTRYKNAVEDRKRDGTFALPPTQIGRHNKKTKLKLDGTSNNRDERAKKVLSDKIA